jgi:hypothetical protein
MTCSKPRPASLDFTLMFDDREWTAVADFSQSGPKDRHYQVRLGEDGEVEIAFGDGEHGRRPPTGRSLRLAYRFGSHYSGVHHQQGRVVLDLDMAESVAVNRTLCGLHQGRVVDDQDPENRSRLRVESPAIPGGQAWATPCRSPGSTELSTIGQNVWLVFEAGDPARPVWLGVTD